MGDGLVPLVGQWVQITTNEPGLFPFGSATPHYGVLEGVDEGAVLLKTWMGETLYLPRASVRSVRVLDPPPTEKDKLLRPSEAPDEESLLRPASSAIDDQDVLLRIPAEPQTDNP